MAITNGYCTLTELRDQLGDSGSKLDQDLLEKAINATSRAVDSHCGRRFWQDPTVQTLLYRPEDHDVAWVDDISTTTGLVIKTDPGFDYSWSETWASTDYDLEPLNADKHGPAYSWYRIIAIGDFPFPLNARRRTLSVTARFGFSAIPDAVNEATIIKAASIFRRKDAIFGVTNFAEFGPIRITRKDPDVIDLLSGQVRFGFGST